MKPMCVKLTITKCNRATNYGCIVLHISLLQNKTIYFTKPKDSQVIFRFTVYNVLLIGKY